TSGWKVLELLRNDLNYRHIPIHLISGEENKMLALKRGARSFQLKPLENEAMNILFKDVISYHGKKIKEILVVEDNEIDSSQMVKMLSGENIKVDLAQSGKEALEKIK